MKGENARDMCESSVFLDEGGDVQEIMSDVTRIVMEGDNASCTNIIGEKMVLEKVKLKEANLLSHGVVFERL
ncbi:MAG: CooT family nickel-binding protein [Methanomassiliicoccales archaeon]